MPQSVIFFGGFYLLRFCVQGKPIDFVEVSDDNMRQWIADFTSKPISMPHRLENMDSKSSGDGSHGKLFIC